MRRVVGRRSTRGPAAAHKIPLWQVVLPVVNHATHHRGMAGAMMRAMGHTPPPLDLSLYYRENAS